MLMVLGKGEESSTFFQADEYSSWRG